MNVYNRSIYKKLVEHLDKKQITVYQLKSGEIGFILDKKISYEVKETATESDLRNLTDISKNLDIEDCHVIGRHPVKLFDLLFGVDSSIKMILIKRLVHKKRDHSISFFI